MKNMTYFLPGFHLSTLRRRPLSALQKLAAKQNAIRDKSISQLGDCFGSFIPSSELGRSSTGAFSRRQLLPNNWDRFILIVKAFFITIDQPSCHNKPVSVFMPDQQGWKSDPVPTALLRLYANRYRTAVKISADISAAFVPESG